MGAAGNCRVVSPFVENEKDAQHQTRSAHTIVPLQFFTEISDGEDREHGQHKTPLPSSRFHTSSLTVDGMIRVVSDSKSETNSRFNSDASSSKRNLKTFLFNWVARRRSGGTFR